jgi:TolB-like protein/Flp pilus assembly protein TadD
MKRCPKCQRIYEDERLKFCRRDGTQLVGVSENFSEEGTKVFSNKESQTEIFPPNIGSENFSTANLLTIPLKKRRSSKSKVIDSLAVLPFSNESKDANAEYLSEGIAECIINTLSHLPKLRVVPSSTAIRYKGYDPQMVGEQLDVRAVLTGRLLQVGKTFVIRTELIDVFNESQLWGEQYRRETADIFTLQEEISREISGKLKIKLNREEKKQLEKRYTENNEAYQCCLKGRYYTNKRTTQWIKKGIEHYQKAIDLDPNYALAYTGLADAYAFLGSSTGESPPSDWYPKTKATALKALEIDDSLAEAHTSLGFYNMMYEWNFGEAKRCFRRAIELNPNYANAHDGYSFYYKATGQHDKAILACRRAQDADPLSLFATVSLGWAYYFARRYDEAVAQNHKALEMDSNFAFAFWNMGLALAQQGKHDESIASLKRAHEITNGLTYLSHLGYVYGLAGKKTEAKKILSQLEKTARKKYVSAYYFALVYLGLNDLQRTFTWLNRACEEHASFLAFLNVEPMFDKIRQDPRFNDLQWRIDLSA